MTARTTVWRAVTLAAFGGMLARVSYAYDAIGLLRVLAMLLLVVVVLWTVQQRRPEMVWVVYAASMVSLPLTAGRIPIGGLLVPPPAIIAALAMVIILIHAMWGGRSPIVSSPAHAWLALTVLGFTICLPWVRFLDVSLAQLAKWTFHVVLFIMLASMTERRWQLLTAKALGLATGGLAAYGLLEYLAGDRYDVNFYEGIGTRGAAGMHLTLVLPVLIALVGMRRTGALWRGLMAAAIVLSVCALALTYARAGWVALVAALLVMAVVGRQGLPVLGLLVVFLGLALVAPEDVQERFGTIFTTGGQGEDASVTNAIRIELMGQAIAMIKANPFVGVGIGNYATSIPWYLYDSMASPYGAVPHNVYLLIWAEGGLLTLVGVLGFLWVVGRDLWRALRQTTTKDARTFLTGLLGSWTAAVVYMMFGDDLNHLLVWTMFGLGLGAARVWRDEPAAVGEPDPVRARLRGIGASVPGLTVGKGA